MNKFIKTIILGLALLVGIGIFANSVKASDDFNLELLSGYWDNFYGGETKTAKLKIINNTGYLLEGKAIFSATYEDELFQGNLEAIRPSFSINSGEWIDFSEWQDGKTTTSEVFIIPKGDTLANFKMQTHPLLMPGEYTFTLFLKGGEYITSPVVIGVRGGYYTSPTTPITETGEVIATPGEGGITTLTNPDGSEIKLTIPSDTVSQNTNFTIDVTDVSSVNRPEPETGLFLIAGLVYEIKAEVNGEFITSFNKALTLSFTYTDEQIEGLDEASLKIYYWDDIQNQWITLENSKVDMDNNTVIASIDHFTLFALMGSEIEFIGEEEEEKEEEEEEEILLEGETEEGIGEEEEGEERVPIGGVLQKGLASMMAAIGMTWGEINKSAFLTIVVILCLMGLVLIGIREWKLFQKKRKR